MVSRPIYQKRAQHGSLKRRVWRKIHLGVDEETLEIRAVEITSSDVGEAIGGATHLRPEFQRMQQMVMQGGFDIMVAEGLDRLSRDQKHIAGLHKRMT